MKKIMITMMYSCFIWVGVANNLVADDPSDSFDIMYVYTTDAKNKVGGTTQMLSQINQTVNFINQSFINSNMNIHVNLVHTEEISYSSLQHANSLGDVWDDMYFRRDGLNYLDTLRNKYNVDMYQLLIARNEEGGLASTMDNPSINFADLAFGVVSVGDNIFALRANSVHEFGHTMGIQHDIYDTSSDGSFSYSHGYGSPNLSFRTIMSTYRACDNGRHETSCKRINYWSSPINLYLDEPLGTNYANARQTILNNAAIIANFRQRVNINAPALSTILPIETFTSSTTIELNGEAGYEVYVNGVYKGVLDSNGKKTITLKLDAVHNDFSITLKHEPSGTESNALTFSIIKKVDTDGDGIYDHIEENLGLNPNNVDSDGDGYTDLEEVGDINSPTDTDNDGIIDALDEDSDNDGISDKDERVSTIVVTTIIVPYILYRN